MTIFLRRERNGSPPVQATVSLTEHGNRIYLRIQAIDGLDISLGAARQDLRALGLEVTPKIQGILHSETDATPPQQFNLITIDDLAQCHSAAERLELLIERFNHSRIDELDPDLGLIEALRADYKALTGHEYRPQGFSKPLRSHPDLELIKPILPEILNADGTPTWGAQQRIAQALGLPGTGGSHRRRILNVLEEGKRAMRKAR